MVLKLEPPLRLHMFFKGSFLTTGPAPHPSAPPSDAGDNPPWDSDDERDFAEQAYSPPSPMSHYPGSLNPLLQFLSHIPDWNSLDKSALDHALEGLPVPIPGPGPRHRRSSFSRQKSTGISIIINNIVYDIVYDIIFYDMIYRIRYHIRYLIRHDTMQCYSLSDSCYIHTGHIVPGCPLSFSLGAVGRFRSVDRF